eukprot:c36571_g1_i1 orf=115-390(-)
MGMQMKHLFFLPEGARVLPHGVESLICLSTVLLYMCKTAPPSSLLRAAKMRMCFCKALAIYGFSKSKLFDSFLSFLIKLVLTYKQILPLIV